MTGAVAALVIAVGVLAAPVAIDDPPTRHVAGPEQAFPQLTNREHEVLELIARGRRNHQIASELLLSERTVRNYVSNILTKLQVDDRGQVITAARDAGLGQPPPT